MALLVRHVMAEAPKSATPDMTAEDAAGLMANYDIGVVPIVEDERLLGLVTDRDLVIRVIAQRQDAREVALRDILTSGDLATISSGAQVSEARELMTERKVRRLPVMEGERFVGIVSLGDIAIADASARAVGETLQAVSESPATTTLNEGGPDIGTPERVAERRREAS